jgi:uncharacterized protein (DUF2236 family)
VSGLPFGEGTVTRRVNLEPVIFLGGGRALLLQVAHPSVAAGVAEHSDYERDPWGRLARTLDVVMKMAFGAPEQSARQQRRLEATHRRVSGVRSDGVPYSASDPALLLWVWATLVDTGLLMYERCFGRLPAGDRERYYQEQKLLAEGCGVPAAACPPAMADFESYVASMVARELHVTPPALAVGAAVTAPALRWPLGPLASVPLRLITTGLLPPSLRSGYGLRWSDADERRLAAAFRLLGAGRLLPRSVRTRPSLWMVGASRVPVPPRFLQAR